MSDELITLYTKETPDAPVSCSRSDYYRNALTTYRKHYPAIIDVFLFNKHGDILLQKRGRAKQNNPGKLHTTVGGHINWGEKAEFSLVHECMEELGTAVLLFSKENYTDAITKLGTYTHKAALVYEVKKYIRDFTQDEIEGNRDVKDMMWLYFGRYDGPIDIPDRDCAGYEWIDLDSLKKELVTLPDQFTYGLKMYLDELEGEMREFIQTFCK